MSDNTEQTVWTDENTDQFFTFLGKYVFFFQWIEGIIDQTLLLAWGNDNYESSQERLTGMRNVTKVRELRDVVLNSPDFRSVQNWQVWRDHFERAIDRLHHLRQQRNNVLHSQYLFDFTQFGCPPMRSNRFRIDGEVNFDHQVMREETQEEIIQDVLILGVDMNFIKVQLVQAYCAPSDFGAFDDADAWEPVSTSLFNS